MASSAHGVTVEEREGADILRMFAAGVTQERPRSTSSRRFARTEDSSDQGHRYASSARAEEGGDGEAELTYGQSGRAGPRGRTTPAESNDGDMHSRDGPKSRRARAPVRQKGSVSESSASSGGQNNSDESSAGRDTSRPSSGGDGGVAARREHGGSGDHDSAVSGSSNDGSSREARDRPSLSQGSVATASRTRVSGSTHTSSSAGTQSSSGVDASLARSSTGKRGRSSTSGAASTTTSMRTDVSVGAPASMRASKRPRRAASSTGAASADDDGMDASSPPPSATGDAGSAEGASGRRAVRRRELNRMNARKSRMRKKAHMELMMGRVSSAETQLRALRTYLIEKVHVDPDTIARAPAHVYEDMMEDDDSDMSEDERGMAHTHASSASVVAPSVGAGSAVSILARSNATPAPTPRVPPPSIITSEAPSMHSGAAVSSQAEPSGPDMALVRTLSAAHLAFILTDPNAPDNPIVYASRGFCELTGYTPEEVIGHNCRFLQGPRTDKAVVDRLRSAIALGQEISAVMLNYRKDGSPFWNFLTIAPLKSSNGHVERYIGIQSCVNAPPMAATVTAAATTLTPHAANVSSAGPFSQVAPSMQSGSSPHAAAYMQAWMNAHAQAYATATGAPMHGAGATMAGPRVPTSFMGATAPPYGWAPTIASGVEHLHMSGNAESVRLPLGSAGLALLPAPMPMPAAATSMPSLALARAMGAGSVSEVDADMHRPRAHSMGGGVAAAVSARSS